ncbi:phospholipid glycerol acyltransferase [Leptolyngbya sp. Heron Island J]|uniref:lysophospholipid acyltransferase family protein n=1 Tax=Leptolyngbya sp. Heron Island J TaxID=1385935 RepID=UPI0003B9AAEC|nr:lysophospholipid acyltransferase family protein [Leptolyngbya sp. Heron Island J]ESA37217.1 phospholipid glycerol acyltransferase [Leptolyngbya sp. Heron Island J]
MPGSSHTVETALAQRDPSVIASLMPKWEWFYNHYFQTRTDGWHHVPKQALFVGSHNGGLAAPDLLMLMVDWFRRFGYERPMYGLMHAKVWQANPGLAQLAAQCGAVPAEPKFAIAALQRGASVLVFPGGAQDVFRPHHQRHQIQLMGRTGFIKLALREKVPIVPVISTGAHDTLIVLENCYEQAKWLNQQGLLPWVQGIDPEVFPIYLGLPWGLAIGPIPHIPWPHPIRTCVCSPIVFEHTGRDAARDNHYVQQCYEQVVTQMQRNLDQLIKA